MVRAMPDRFSVSWWKLWRSGAIPRDVVYFGFLADELERYRLQDQGTGGYFDPYAWTVESPNEVRRGRKLIGYSRAFVDLAARVSSDLRLPWKTYLKLTEQLFGKPAPELFQVKP
jgi:hypothetical protein